MPASSNQTYLASARLVFLTIAFVPEVSMHACMCACVYVCMHVCVHACVCVCVCVYVLVPDFFSNIFNCSEIQLLNPIRKSFHLVDF